MLAINEQAFMDGFHGRRNKYIHTSIAYGFYKKGLVAGRTKIYQKMLGKYYGVPLNEWEKIVREAIKNDGAFTLKEEWGINGRPLWVKSYSHGGDVYSTREDKIIHEPLDWTKEEFEDELERIFKNIV